MHTRPPETIGTSAREGALISVIVTTFNDATFLEPSLRSILDQRMEPGAMWVSVHDDASTDGTQDILRALAAEYPERLSLILQQDNQMSRGQFGPRVYMPELTTPYVTFADGDDLWTDPHKLAKQVAFMDANPWCSISHHDIEISIEGGSEDYADVLRDYLAENQSRALRTPGISLAEGNTIMTCAAVLRTSSLRMEVLNAMVGLMPEDYVTFSLAAESGDIGYLPDAMSRYRLDGHNFWAALTPLEREGFEIDTLWFMSSHLRGPIQRRIQERLTESLLASPSELALSPIRRMRREQAELAAERDSLRERLAASESALSVVLSQMQAGQSLVESLVHELRAYRNANG